MTITNKRRLFGLALCLISLGLAFLFDYLNTQGVPTWFFQLQDGIVISFLISGLVLLVWDTKLIQQPLF